MDIRRYAEYVWKYIYIYNIYNIYIQDIRNMHGHIIKNISRFGHLMHGHTKNISRFGHLKKYREHVWKHSETYIQKYKQYVWTHKET